MWWIVLPRRLGAVKKRSKESSILVLGLAYKPNVDDERESPSYALMEMLEGRGAKVAYHDPYVRVIKPTREHGHWAGTKSVEWNQAAIAAFDVILIATNHACFNYQELAAWAACIVDTRNAMHGNRDAPREGVESVKKMALHPQLGTLARTALLRSKAATERPQTPAKNGLYETPAPPS